MTATTNVLQLRDMSIPEFKSIMLFPCLTLEDFPSTEGCKRQEEQKRRDKVMEFAKKLQAIQVI